MAETKRDEAAATFPVDDDCRLMARIRKVIEDKAGTARFDVRRGRGQFSVYFRLNNGKEITFSGATGGWHHTLTKALAWWDEMTEAKPN